MIPKYIEAKKNESQIIMNLMERAVRPKKMPKGTLQLIEKSFEAEFKFSFRSIEKKYFKYLSPYLKKKLI